MSVIPPKRDKSKGKDKLNVAHEDEEESSFLVVLADEHDDLLLHDNMKTRGGFPYDNMWYLDTNVSSHMTSRRSHYHFLDENQNRMVRFGDGSSIMYGVMGVQSHHQH